MNEVIGIILVSGTVAIGTILAIGFVTTITVRSIRGGGSKKSRGLDSDETRLIQEIYNGLSKMESRIESLETLMLDDDRRKRSGFDKELHNG